MKAYRSVSATTSTTTAQISDGAKERVAWAAAAWKMSDSGSFNAGEFVLVPANQPVPVTKNVITYAQGSAGTVTVYVATVIQ